MSKLKSEVNFGKIICLAARLCGLSTPLWFGLYLQALILV